MSATAQDLVLEIGDCEVFVRAHDAHAKGSLSRDELAAFLAPDVGQDAAGSKSKMSIQSDDQYGQTMREQETAASQKLNEPTE